MDNLFAHVNHWHWWALAAVLMVLEMFTAGTFFMFMAVAAFVVGVLLMVTPLSWEAQVLWFGGLSVAVTVAGRAFLKRRPIATDRPTLNRRGEQYVGRNFTLDEPIANGVGKIRVDDSAWKISGADCPAGTRVRVSAVDGTVFRVEIVDK